MTPSERTTKIAELRAEADRLERGWPDKIERGMVFQQMATKEVYIMSGRNRLVCVTDGGEWSGDQGFSNRENDFVYLGHACDLLAIKTPDEEPTGAELRGAKLIGKLCDFSEDGIYWEDYQGGRECNAYAPPAGYSWGMQGRWFKHARLYREGRP